jgi:hypothetical protein
MLEVIKFPHLTLLPTQSLLKAPHLTACGIELGLKGFDARLVFLEIRMSHFKLPF